MAVGVGRIDGGEYARIVAQMQGARDRYHDEPYRHDRAEEGRHSGGAGIRQETPGGLSAQHRQGTDTNEGIEQLLIHGMTEHQHARTGLKALRRLMDAKDAAGASAIVPQTFSIVDRAAKWGVIKKNTAARYKSRIALRLRKLQAA